MHRTAVCAIILACVGCPVFAEDWSEFRGCVAKQYSDVGVAWESIDEGASLIVDALCVHEATGLANQLVRSRPNVSKDHGFAGAIESFLFVIRRETRVALFEARKNRLGL